MNNVRCHPVIVMLYPTYVIPENHVVFLIVDGEIYSVVNIKVINVVFIANCHPLFFTGQRINSFSFLYKKDVRQLPVTCSVRDPSFP